MIRRHIQGSARDWIALFLFLPWWSSADEFSLKASGHDSRVDLTWRGATGWTEFLVERSDQIDGAFQLISEPGHEPTVYSDFLGTNGLTRFYRVVARGESRATSAIASATSRSMSDDELLGSVQEATFRYFWDYAHPVSGLARERKGSGDTVTSGGSGFGLMALVVGAERGFVDRGAVASRVLTMLEFLGEKADRFHGAWPHWLNGRTGRTIPFSRYDDGGDLVESSFLVQGLLTVRQYFNRPEEEPIRRRATELWESVEWDWYLREPGGRKLYWHWSPNHAWKMNHPIGGHFNECMITYLLAMASPTHAISPECYRLGWIGEPPEAEGRTPDSGVRSQEQYANGQTYYGIKQWVGWPMGGPLFFTQYSFLGFDPRGKRDQFCDYFENNRNICLIQRAYCIENPNKHQGYSALVWGLTASDTPGGYQAHEPRLDNGTVSPSAALSAMPYVPQESIATLRHLYHHYGLRLWGEFGFRDAFNLDRDWFAKSYLAIDQGPIVVMIENYRTGLCWRLFMSNPEIAPMLKAAGFRILDF